MSERDRYMSYDVPGELKTGKLPVEVLARSVLSRRGKARSEVVLHASVGEDSCAIDPSRDLVVMSTDPITGAEGEIGWLSVHIACNDVAANGAEPVGVLVTLLSPQGSRVSDVERVMAGVDAAARELGIEVLGGHTEVTAAVVQPVISTTAVGLAPADGLVTKSGAAPGDAIIMTKGAGLEGTAILATDFGDVLAASLGEELVERAREFIREISVVREGLIAARCGATAMHDVTEGGVLGALWEMAGAPAASGASMGFTIRLNDVPVREETAAICRVAGVDPLRLVSSGAMLIAARPGASRDILGSLRGASIEAATIGEFTTGGRVLVAGGREISAGAPESDHIWAARSRLDGMRDTLRGVVRGRPTSR
ncbi:MAG: AIR synthase [Firmicutes bacterium]|nr:AIR synthase [Bacillota bacterium]